MICESAFWKEELEKIAAAITRRCQHQRRWPEAALAKLEREVMIGSFIVRKLMDSNKITTILSNADVEISCYPFHGMHIPDHFNWHNIEQFYDVESCSDSKLPLRDVCNQLIHSFVFLPVLDETSRHLAGILFTSDRKRNAYLYKIEAKKLVDVFHSVATNYPTKMAASRDTKGQWKIVSE